MILSGDPHLRGRVERTAGDSAQVLWDDGDLTWCDRSDLIVTRPDGSVHP